MVKYVQYITLLNLFREAVNRLLVTQKFIHALHMQLIMRGKTQYCHCSKSQFD